MFDAFPFDEWGDGIADFWTFGPANSTGTYILTVLGVLLMIGSLIGFVRLESGKLARQADALRRAARPVPPPNEPPGNG